jgi:hypothetical protein
MTTERVGRVEAHWRRWFLEWLVVFLWIGLLPVIVSAAYFALKKDAGFDSALKSRSISNIPSATDLLWAVRVGGTTQHRSGIAIYSTQFGVNTEDGNSEQRGHRVSNGELKGTYQATYIARFRSPSTPTIVCVFLDVAPDGTNSYEVQTHGGRPIRNYILYSALFSAGFLAFFKIASVVAKRRTVAFAAGRK